MTPIEKARAAPRPTVTLPQYRRLLRDSGMVSARIDKVMTNLEEMPATMRRTYFKAATGEASPRECIQAFCAECVGWDRASVTECTSIGCSLYLRRPWK